MLRKVLQKVKVEEERIACGSEDNLTGNARLEWVGSL